MTRIAIMTIVAGFVYGCVEVIHSDYSSTFFVSGLVKTQKEETTSSDHHIIIQLFDIGLDDERYAHQRQILLAVIKNGESFSLKRTYFWGSSLEDPFESGLVAVVVSAEGCQRWSQLYNAFKFLDENNDIRIAIFEIQLNCT